MTVRIHYPPNAPVDDTNGEQPLPPAVFLAGTIDMGDSPDWQGAVIAALGISGLTCDVFNPRRAAWDSSWEQTIENEQFRQQVVWELDHIEQCNVVAFNFEPGSKSPITLLELGLVCGDHAWANTKRIIVRCPEGYWRRGNVEIMCDRFGLMLVDSMDEFVGEIERAIGDLS